MNLTIYQTLEYREDQSLDEVENNGPFPCRRENAWLGSGFYFWDTHIELAHAWGYNGYFGKYLICESSIVHSDSCFDLVGNGNHQLEFNKITHELTNNPKYLKKNIRVPQVIEHLKDLKVFLYDSIRAYGEGSLSNLKLEGGMPRTLPFTNKNNRAKMNLFKEIQICLVNRDSLNREGFEIIHPEECRSDYGMVF